MFLSSSVVVKSSNVVKLETLYHNFKQSYFKGKHISIGLWNYGRDAFLYKSVLIFMTPDGEIVCYDLKKHAPLTGYRAWTIVKEKNDFHVNETFCTDDNRVLVLRSNGEMIHSPIKSKRPRSISSLINSTLIKKLPTQHFTTINKANSIILVSSVAAAQLEKDKELVSIHLVSSYTFNIMHTASFEFPTYFNSHHSRNPIHKFQPLKKSSLVLASSYVNCLTLFSIANKKLSLVDCMTLDAKARSPLIDSVVLRSKQGLIALWVDSTFAFRLSLIHIQ